MLFQKNDRSRDARTKIGILVLVILIILLVLLRHGAHQESFLVSPYTGIPNLVSLGDSFKKVTNNSNRDFTVLDITSNSSLTFLGMVYGIFFPSIGTSIYFKRGGSCLIVLESPFKGKIRSTNLPLFEQNNDESFDWEQSIRNELGPPQKKDRDISSSNNLYFYSWGDIEFNADGIVRMMLYRDPRIALFRNFIPQTSYNLFQ